MVTIFVGVFLLIDCTKSVAQQVATNFQFPVNNYLTSVTNPFDSPNPNYGNKRHVADDVSGMAGVTEVVSVAKGKVMFAQPWKRCPNWGHVIVIEHVLADGRLVNSIYGHLDPSSIQVTEGQDVDIGQKIGIVGNYRECWDDHLHFGIRLGSFGVPVGVYPAWLAGYLSVGYVAHQFSGGLIKMRLVGSKANDNFPAQYCDPSTFITTFVCEVTKTIPVGQSLRNLAVTPDGAVVYIADANLGKVFVFDAINDIVTKSIDVGFNPLEIAITPDGAFAYVTVNAEDKVAVIRTSDNTVVDNVSVERNPGGIAITPDGTFVYVTNITAGTVSVIRTSDNTVVDNFAVGGGGPDSIIFTPDGSLAYVTRQAADEVSVIRTSDNSVFETVSVGNFPRGLTITPDGAFVYVTNDASNDVSVIRTADNTEVKRIPVGSRPVEVAAMPLKDQNGQPNGAFMFVANFGANTVSVIRTADNMVVDTINVGSGPRGVAIFPFMP